MKNDIDYIWECIHYEIKTQYGIAPFRNFYNDMPLKKETTETQKNTMMDLNDAHESKQTDIEKCTSLEELSLLCETMDTLRTDLANTNMVFGVGNPNAHVMFIGEAPGEEEDRKKEPFVGRAGKLLDKMIKAIDFSREEIYIGNILKHRPPNNRNPLLEEINRSLPIIMKQISLIKPAFIMCLGRIAAHAILKTTQPMKVLRTQVHDPFKVGKACQVLVTFHPAALLRNPIWKRDAWTDLKLLRKLYHEYMAQ